jgi:hypothetical protein
MLIYDSDRTEKIIERLRDAEAVMRFVTVLSTFGFFGLLGASAGAGSPETAIVGGVLGAFLGLVVGRWSMLLTSSVIEWMCQSLIAQGEQVEILRSLRPNSRR